MSGNFLQTMRSNLYFGEEVPGYEVRVLNEREVRAASGILLVFAMAAGMSAFLVQYYFLLELFIVCFLIDFVIRLFINPKYSPSLVLGRIAVQNQRVEYTGAPQKQFAWSLGLFMSMVTFYVVIVSQIRGALPLSLCGVCLVLLFAETAFGICVGCRIFELVRREKAKLCPGNVCELSQRENIQMVRYSHIAALIAFIAVVAALAWSTDMI